jgi:hypothetical protein
MNAQLFQQPFFSVALPLMLSIFMAVSVQIWSQNKRFDDVNRRLDEIVGRLTRIEAKLDNHEERIIRLEEMTSPLGKVRA